MNPARGVWRWSEESHQITESSWVKVTGWTEWWTEDHDFGGLGRQVVGLGDVLKPRGQSGVCCSWCPWCVHWGMRWQVSGTTVVHRWASFFTCGSGESILSFVGLVCLMSSSAWFFWCGFNGSLFPLYLVSLYWARLGVSHSSVPPRERCTAPGVHSGNEVHTHSASGFVPSAKLNAVCKIGKAQPECFLR